MRLTKFKTDLAKELAANEKAVTAMKSPELLAVEKEIAALDQKKRDNQGRSNRYGYHSLVAKKQDVVKWVQVDLGKSSRIDLLILAASDEYGFADFGFPHRFKIEVSDDADFKKARMIADHTAEDHARPGGNLMMFECGGAEARYVRVTATKLWSRRRAGQPKSQDWIFALGELAVFVDKKTLKVEKVTALDSIEALPRWGKNDLIDGVYGAFPIAPDEVLATIWQSAAERSRKLSELDLKRIQLERIDLDEAVLKKGRELSAELEKIGAELAGLPAQKQVYAGTVHTGSGTFKGRGHAAGKPRTITVLARGDVRNPGVEVDPGTVALFPNATSRFQLPPDHAEGARRVALADWIVHKDNPLTWRTIVNRVWLYHFGRGIVDSPNDFGRMGQLPTHPDLLDWLAMEFRDGGQSIKDLHRLIVNSATYRQESRHDAESAEIDGSNRFLWRMNRRKLEAEALRDTVLSVSGKLDLKMYGPGYYDFVLEKTAHSPHYQYHKHDPDDPKSHRRSIYRFLVRSQPAPFMDTLDCADPSLSVDKRNETLTALQALALLNNKFVVRMSEHFAEKLKDEADPVARAIELTLSRPANEGELESLRAYAEKHGLAAACRVIFNLNEFAFVD